MPLHGEVVLSLTRLNQLGPVDHEASQVMAGAGVTLRQVADAARATSGEAWTAKARG